MTAAKKSTSPKPRKAAPTRSGKPPAKSTTADKSLTVDYRHGKVPKWVGQLISKYITFDNELGDVALGFMARALVQATMPYKDPKNDVFVRKNGDFTLRILAGYEGGIPYGVYPRLLMGWIATEAVRTQSPRIELGSSLSAFLRDVLGLSHTGGPRGTATLVTEQMKRLFGSLLTAHYDGGSGGRGFNLRNVLIAESLDLDPHFADRLQNEIEKEGKSAKAKAHHSLWIPQSRDEAGQWDSHVMLTSNFFAECVTNPVPINLGAYKDLRGSPLAMDVYTWITYRMSYLTQRSRPIPWRALMMQFGSNYSTDSAVRDFRKAFLQALKAVKIVYPKLNVEETNGGLVLLPSPTHVQKLSGMKPLQTTLF